MRKTHAEPTTSQTPSQTQSSTHRVPQHLTAETPLARCPYPEPYPDPPEAGPYTAIAISSAANTTLFHSNGCLPFSVSNPAPRARALHRSAQPSSSNEPNPLPLTSLKAKRAASHEQRR